MSLRYQGSIINTDCRWTLGGYPIHVARIRTLWVWWTTKVNLISTCVCVCVITTAAIALTTMRMAFGFIPGVPPGSVQVSKKEAKEKSMSLMGESGDLCVCAWCIYVCMCVAVRDCVCKLNVCILLISVCVCVHVSFILYGLCVRVRACVCVCVRVCD